MRNTFWAMSETECRKQGKVVAADLTASDFTKKLFVDAIAGFATVAKLTNPEVPDPTPEEITKGLIDAQVSLWSVWQQV